MDDIDAEFPAPPDLSNPALNLVAYSVLCPARDLSLQEVQDLITDVSNRDLPHDADRRKLMFQTIIAWRETNAGLCPAKVEKYLTTLGVPYQLHRTNLGVLQKQVGKTIEQMAIESCAKALQEETLLAKEKGDMQEGVVQLGVSGDAAWPNRGSGRSYASFCGMFVMMGALMKKIISTTIFDKMCITCERAEATQPPCVPPVHDCWRGARGINCQSNMEWRGSSKAMEAEGAVMCVKSIGEHTFQEPIISDTLLDVSVRVAKFTADEDSNMIASINDVNGLVPAKLLPVEKLSDPNHLQKLLYKDLEALRKEKKWGGSTLSKTVIEYFNKQYCTVTS
ncbi:hypothetical protein CYMTET_46544 [Cymbomonas tetramitiformis]|uniref:Mutator-like transposase domain-containing protein n=1 Tax=Cymbomonas tetramitiformis TaxID=36881 RepID=A0AAE0EXH4_9CHLO|nr:hypothetical protein CYMTET_46544 [Cymbomonas tetramitiformis]